MSVCVWECAKCYSTSCSSFKTFDIFRDRSISRCLERCSPQYWGALSWYKNRRGRGSEHFEKCKVVSSPVKTSLPVSWTASGKCRRWHCILPRDKNNFPRRETMFSSIHICPVVAVFIFSFPLLSSIHSFLLASLFYIFNDCCRPTFDCPGWKYLQKICQTRAPYGTVKREITDPTVLFSPSIAKHFK